MNFIFFERNFRHIQMNSRRDFIQIVQRVANGSVEAFGENAVIFQGIFNCFINF